MNLFHVLIEIVSVESSILLMLQICRQLGGGICLNTVESTGFLSVLHSSIQSAYFCKLFLYLDNVFQYFFPGKHCP